MCEFAIAQIYSHMADFVGRVEKNQIAAVQFLWTYKGADLNLQLGGTRQIDMEQFAIDLLDKSRTVNPRSVVAAHFVWGSGPATDHIADLPFYGGCLCRPRFILLRRIMGGNRLFRFRERHRFHRATAEQQQVHSCYQTESQGWGARIFVSIEPHS